MKLCILDKDWTLVRPVSGGTFVQFASDQELIPGVKEKISAMTKEGWSFAIASNQGGCEAINRETGKPYKTLDEAITEMRFCMTLLPAIDCAYFCPSRPKTDGDHCWQVLRRAGFERALNWNILAFDFRLAFDFSSGFRKPNPGMLQLASCLEEADEAMYVGDLAEDQQAAEAAKMPFQWAHEWRDDT